MAYTVFIDDNFHYQDESERVTHGQFETAEEAIAACRSIVDDFAERKRLGLSQPRTVVDFVIPSPRR